MLDMLAKDDYVALKREAEDRWRWSHRTSFQKSLYSRILEEEEFWL